MGKIVGIGGGLFENGEIKNIAEYIYSLAEKEKPTLLFFPTASFDECSKDDATVKTFAEIGCRCEVIYLTKEKDYSKLKSKILGCDVVYFDGGNLKFLMDTLKSTGMDKLLKEAFEKGKVLSGYSSGMMCWFAQGYDDCDEGNFMFVDCLNFLPYTICPHFEGGNWPSFEKAVKGNKYSAFAVENGAALVHLNGKKSVVCGNEGGRVYFMDKEKAYAKEIFGSEEQR